MLAKRNILVSASHGLPLFPMNHGLPIPAAYVLPLLPMNHQLPIPISLQSPWITDWAYTYAEINPPQRKEKGIFIELKEKGLFGIGSSKGKMIDFQVKLSKSLTLYWVDRKVLRLFT
jgi:hypothetical protein